MANANVTGFWPIKDVGSGPITHRRAQVNSTYGTAIFTGDPVSPATTTGYWNVTADGTTNPIGSVSQGASYVNADGNRVHGPYLPASLTYTGALDADGASFIFIVERPEMVTFEGQFDAAPTGIADLGENVPHVAASGSTLTGLSGYQLHYAGHVATTDQWRIVEFVNRVDNDPTLTRAKVRCRINEIIQAAFAKTAAGV